MKRSLRAFAIPFFLFCFWFSNLRAEPVPIRVGILPIVEALPFLIIQEKGLFDPPGFKMEIVPFASALERDSAIQSGRVQAAILDILGLTLFKSKGVPFTIVTDMMAPSSKRDLYTLLASPGSKVQTLRQLRGRTVAFSSHTMTEYVLDGILSREKLKSTDVDKVEVKRIPLRFQMVLEGKVDAAILPEPLGSLALKEGARRIAGDFGLRGTQTVLTFQESFIREHPEAFILFGNAYQRAIRAFQEDPPRWRDLLVKKGGLPPAVKDMSILASFSDIRLPTPEDIGSIQSWMRGKGMDAPTVQYLSLVNDGWVKQGTK